MATSIPVRFPSQMWRPLLHAVDLAFPAQAGDVIERYTRARKNAEVLRLFGAR